VHVQVKSKMTLGEVKRVGGELRDLVPDSCEVMIVAREGRRLLWWVREGDEWTKLDSRELNRRFLISPS
jgi:hypothetical protein